MLVNMNVKKTIKNRPQMWIYSMVHKIDFQGFSSYNKIELEKYIYFIELCEPDKKENSTQMKPKFRLLQVTFHLYTIQQILKSKILDYVYLGYIYFSYGV